MVTGIEVSGVQGSLYGLYHRVQVQNRETKTCSVCCPLFSFVSPPSLPVRPKTGLLNSANAIPKLSPNSPHYILKGSLSTLLFDPLKETTETANMIHDIKLTSVSPCFSHLQRKSVYFCCSVLMVVDERFARSTLALLSCCW